MNTQRAKIFDGTIAPLHPYIEHAIEENYWFHRSEWMEEMIREIRTYFSKELGATYKTQIITASRNGANEACLANAVTAQSIVITGSQDPWRVLAEKMGIQTVEGGSFLRDSKAKTPLLCITLQIGSVDRAYAYITEFKGKYPSGKILIDASDVFGSSNLHYEKLSADAIVISPERSLGGIPGCSLIVHTHVFLDHVRSVRPQTIATPYTFDLLKYDTSGDKGTTPYSPDISATVGLYASLRLLQMNGGIAGLIERHHQYSQKMVSILHDLGLATNCITPTYTEIIVSSPKWLIETLSKEKVYISHGKTVSSVRIWHMGWIENDIFNDLHDRLAKILRVTIKNKNTYHLPSVTTPPAWQFKDSGIFEVDPSEFIKQAVLSAEQYKNRDRKDMIRNSAQRLFHVHEDYSIQQCFPERIVGFIGAGKTVREAAYRLQRVGVKNIIVYSPSLARKKREGAIGTTENHTSVAYWNNRGIRVASSADEIFLQAHTVVLLPTLYNKTALRIFKKGKEYRNDGLVNDKLLKRIYHKGRMDLLINASAREELIVRKDLAKHISQGWLTFISDELPNEKDPLFKTQNTYMTGHVGGSPSLTKKRIAQNTRLLVTELLKEDPSYEKFSFINSHLKPLHGWRPGLFKEKEVRILLTDIFDKETLNLEAVKSALGAVVRILDTSQQHPSHKNILNVCKTFKPHIVMIRTRTVIDSKMAEIIVNTPSIRALIRPGVGLDNLYGGIEHISDGGIRIFNEPTGNSFSVGEMVTHFILNGTPKLILAPGPTNMKKDVFRVGTAYTSPLSNDFQKKYTATLRMLDKWIGRKGRIIMHATPSTGLMEAAIVNLSHVGDTGGVIAHGKFGSRFIQIADSKLRNVWTLTTKEESWGKAFSTQEVATLFKTASKRHLLLTFLCLQQHETSTGVAYNTRRLHSIIKEARAHNKDIMIIVDGVSATAADSIPYNRLDVDAVVVGSQKAFGLSSGLSFISLSKRALKYMQQGSLATLNNHTDYYNLPTLLNENCVHFIPSVFHILSAHVSLSILTKEGGPRAVARRHETLAKTTRSFAKQHHLPLLTHKGYESNAVTAIKLPPPFHAPTIRRRLEREYGIFIAGAQSEGLKPFLIRIGHLGYVYERDLARFLRAFSVILRESQLSS